MMFAYRPKPIYNKRYLTICNNNAHLGPILEGFNVNLTVSAGLLARFRAAAFPYACVGVQWLVSAALSL